VPPLLHLDGLNCVQAQLPRHWCTMNEMTDRSPADPEQSVQEQRAFSEAAERAKRLRAWLDGVLLGGPSHADAQNDRRQEPAMYGASAENFAGDTDDLHADMRERVEDSLLKCRRRVRERRELAGMSPLEIAEEEHERRSSQMIASIQTDRAAGSEPTPLHLVLAARYIEGERDFELYSSAVRKV